MINVASVLSLKNLPQLAGYGYSLIFFMIWSCICFFIPSVLVSAELASGWPRKGGMFLWVKEAFGAKWGLIAVFMQWTTNISWFPSMLAFMASTLAYTVDPTLASNKPFILIVTWVALWGATFLNFNGMKLSSFLSSSGVVLGTIIPSAMLIILGIIHIFSKQKLAIPFSTAALLPKLNELNQLMFLIGIIMSTTGIEISSVHITEVKNPKKNFAKAIFIACFMIIFFYIAGALSIAITIPKGNLSLCAGLMQGIEYLCSIYSLKWIPPLIAIFIAYGAFTTVITLMIGPSKAMQKTAQDGYLPKFMQKNNKNGMPIGVLIAQAVISAVLSLVIIFMPSVSSAFWIMTALSAQLYFIMYLLMFASAIKLRYSRPNTKRSFEIPGGKITMWIISGTAFLTLSFAIIFGFIPVESVREKGTIAMISYMLFLLIGIVVFMGIPIILYHKLSPEKQPRGRL